MYDYEKKKRNMHIRSIESIMLSGLHNPDDFRNVLNMRQSPDYIRAHQTMNNSTIFARSRVTVNDSKIRHQDNKSQWLYQTEKENKKLANRIAQSQPTISSKKQRNEWKVLKYYLRVRSKFKPEMEVEEPRIFKLQQKIGIGRQICRLKIDYLKLDVKAQAPDCIYYLVFRIGGKKYESRKVSFRSLFEGETIFNVPRSCQQCRVRLIKLKGNEQADMGCFTVYLDQEKQEAQLLKKNGFFGGSIRYRVLKEQNADQSNEQ